MRKPFSILLLLPFLHGCSGGGAKLLWQAPIASETPPIVRNGTVYVKGFHAGRPGEAVRLFALETQTGKERWSSADSVKEVYGESGGSVYFTNASGHLVQVDARTGAKLHETGDSNFAIRSWAIQDDRMFLVNAKMEVVAVDTRLNKEIWRRKMPFKSADDTDLQLNGQQVIVSGNFRTTPDQFGMVWSLDTATGKERWHFEVPPPHDYAPLKVLANESYILATNTAPTVLHTHVLSAETGKELYPPIGAFDVYGCYGNTAYASNGAFDLKTGQRTGDKAAWFSGSIVHNGIAWKRRTTTVGTGEALFLRAAYDGDYRGSRDWTNTPPNSSLEGFDVRSGKSSYQTQEYKYTRFSAPVEANGVLYHTGIAMMKEGKSGVWVYRLP